jgi:hypothetical protein
MPDHIGALCRVLRAHPTIAVAGLSAEWHRPSCFAAKYMLGKGYRFGPVYPRYPEILGGKCRARLEDTPFGVDLVDVFRKEADMPVIAKSAVAIGARRFWQQLGLESVEADAIARTARLGSVMKRRVKI